MEKSRRKSILSEIGILKNSEHPNIIKLISCIETHTEIILIFEYSCAVSMDFAIKMLIRRRYPE